MLSNELEARHERFQSVLRQARAAVPADWRQTLVRRADLDRFLFAPEDVIVAVGQDGLVANVAKYLTGQPVLGVNSAPDLYDGVLVRVGLDRLGAALPASLHDDVAVEHRTMVEGMLDKQMPPQYGNRVSVAQRFFTMNRKLQWEPIFQELRRDRVIS